MISHRAPSMASPHVIQFAISLTVCLPFLVPGSRMPARAIESDMLAIMAGLLTAMLVCLRKNARIPLPDILAMPAILLGMIGLQASLGKLALPEFAITYAAYIAWAAIMVMMASLMTRQTNHAGLFTAIATGIVAAATINAISCLIQIALTQSAAFGIRGLVGQSNRLATLLWLGILSAYHLHRCHRINRPSLLTLTLLLGGISVLTGQRIIYLLCIGLAVTLTWTSEKEQLLKQTIRMACFRSIAGMVFLWLAGMLAQHLLGVSGVSAADRATPALLKTDIRIAEWRDTLTIVFTHPWIGAGAGNFRRELLDAAALAPPGAVTIPDLEHSHNLILQWLAEFGIPATLLLITSGILIIGSGLHSHSRNHRLMPAGLIALVGIHSLLEYPLWFAEFLGPTALILGGLSPVRRSIHLPYRASIGILTCALIIATVTFMDYRKISVIYSGTREPQTDAADLEQLSRHTLVSPYVHAIRAARMQPSIAQAEAQAITCEKALRVWPSAAMAGRCTGLYFMAGQLEQGNDLLKIGHAAFRTRNDLAMFDHQIEMSQSVGKIQNHR